MFKFHSERQASVHIVGYSKETCCRFIHNAQHIHMTETWRYATVNKLVSGAISIEFQNWVFDCGSHPNLLHKREHNFGITGNLLAIVINGVPSNTKVAHGIPQDSVFGPILCFIHKQSTKSCQHCNNFPVSDDTTMYCFGESVDQITTMLDKSLDELVLRCKKNSWYFTPKSLREWCRLFLPGNLLSDLYVNIFTLSYLSLCATNLGMLHK